MKKIIGSFSLVLTTLFAMAQQANLNTIAAEVRLNEQQQVNYVKLKESNVVLQSNVENFINEQFFNGSLNKVAAIGREEDNLGYTHIRYQIQQNAVPLANKMILAHIKQGKLVSLNGDLSELGMAQNGFAITEQKALASALAKVNAKKYKWENKFEEDMMKEEINDPDFTFFPKAQKMVFEKSGVFYNCYVFNVYADEPMYRANVFVDASTGIVLEEQNLLCMIDVPGTAVTKYSGTQTVTVDQTGSVFSLKEAVRGIGLGIETKNMNNGTSFNASTSFTNSVSNWTTTGFDQGAADAHWGAEKTYDYYYLQHNRNSINNAGFKLWSYVHYSNNWANASWDGQRMRYGDGNGSFKIFTTLDICGHEITHGLTSNSSNLVYANESGALNESYSDIFGNSIENFARPTNWNWKVGEDMTTSGNGLRSMSNPNADGNPDTYLGTNWYTGTGDNGGVHTNSGVSNFWYYLLVGGGTGTNDIGNAYSVSGIGFNSASRIAFRALTVYFTPNTNYANARNLTIQAAKDLFGNCSNEVIQTINAWHAVGIGVKYDPSTIAPNFSSASSVFCSLPATATFYNLTNYGVSYDWDFGDGSPVYTGLNASHTYTAVGMYNVKLKVNGCATDSLTKPSYISINVLPSPSTEDVVFCENTTAILTATSSSTVKWSNDASFANVLGTGTVFTSPVLSSGATYYVANALSFSAATGGMAKNSSGGYQTSFNQWLTFDVIQPGILNSVVMVVGTLGDRIIELRDGSNFVVNSTTVNLAVGTHTVYLFFPLSVGTGYRLALGSGSSAYVYRNTAGAIYPYNIGSCVSITGSNGTSGSYFWFYDWEVQRNDCVSPVVPVVAQMDQCVGIGKIEGLDSGLKMFPNPAKDFIEISSTSGSVALQVTIKDLSGRIVASKNINVQDNQIELQNVSKGLYLVNVSDESGRSIQTFKLVKE